MSECTFSHDASERQCLRAFFFFFFRSAALRISICVQVPEKVLVPQVISTFNHLAIDLISTNKLTHTKLNSPNLHQNTSDWLQHCMWRKLSLEVTAVPWVAGPARATEAAET